MITIYKTTESAGKREILSLHDDSSTDDVLNNIKRVAERMAWGYSFTQGGIVIDYPGEKGTEYTVRENNFLPLGDER